jgi:esterase/lipase superfamily enzyme
MNRQYFKWHSPSLSREMELLVFGHAGARLLVFPTSKGKYYEWEDRGMMRVLGDHIDSGNLQVFLRRQRGCRELSTLRRASQSTQLPADS